MSLNTAQCLNMAKDVKESILLRDAESNEVYSILVTSDEAKRLETGKFHSLLFFPELLLLQNI